MALKDTKDRKEFICNIYIYIQSVRYSFLISNLVLVFNFSGAPKQFSGAAGNSLGDCWPTCDVRDYPGYSQRLGIEPELAMCLDSELSLQPMFGVGHWGTRPVVLGGYSLLFRNSLRNYSCKANILQLGYHSGPRNYFCLGDRMWCLVLNPGWLHTRQGPYPLY